MALDATAGEDDGALEVSRRLAAALSSMKEGRPSPPQAATASDSVQAGEERLGEHRRQLSMKLAAALSSMKEEREGQASPPGAAAVGGEGVQAGEEGPGEHRRQLSMKLAAALGAMEADKRTGTGHSSEPSS